MATFVVFLKVWLMNNSNRPEIVSDVSCHKSDSGVADCNVKMMGDSCNSYQSVWLKCNNSTGNMCIFAISVDSESCWLYKLALTRGAIKLDYATLLFRLKFHLSSMNNLLDYDWKCQKVLYHIKCSKCYAHKIYKNNSIPMNHRQNGVRWFTGKEG